MKKLIKVLDSKNVAIQYVDKGRVLQLSGSKDCQGVVLKTSTYPYASFDDMLGSERLLMLDNVEDPHNVGAILRTAEIFGFRSVLLPNKGTPDVYPSVVKVSAGATEFMDIAKETSSIGYTKKALEAGYKIVVLDARGKVDVSDLRSDSFDKLLLVIGGEDRPVGQYVVNNADCIARINQKGRINSLNASVAASIAMFCLSR